jgi:hypothetical protein
MTKDLVPGISFFQKLPWETTDGRDSTITTLNSSLLSSFRGVDAQVMSSQFPTASMNSSRVPPRRTDHTYRDFSKFSVDKLPMNKKAQTNFPTKLHQILSTPEFSHVSHVGGVWSTVALHFRISEKSSLSSVF